MKERKEGVFLQAPESSVLCSLGITLCLAFFCVLSFVSFVLRHLCSGTCRWSRKKGRKEYSHNPVGPLTGSGAPCRGGGLSMFSLILNFPQLLFLQNNPKIIQKFTNNYCSKDSNLMEPFFRLNEIEARFWRKSGEIYGKQGTLPECPLKNWMPPPPLKFVHHVQ